MAIGTGEPITYIPSRIQCVSIDIEPGRQKSLIVFTESQITSHVFRGRYPQHVLGTELVPAIWTGNIVQ